MPSINRQRNTEGLKTKTEQSRLHQIAVRMWDQTLTVCRITQSFWKTFFKTINTMWTSNSTGKNLPNRSETYVHTNAHGNVIHSNPRETNQTSIIWGTSKRTLPGHNEEWSADARFVDEPWEDAQWARGTQRAPAARERSKTTRACACTAVHTCWESLRCAVCWWVDFMV